MPARHVAAGVLVALLWGVNFVAIDASLVTFPPFLLAALRFGLIAIPTMIWVPTPDAPVRWLLGYGLGFGIIQFGFLYWAMNAGMPPGLASLVLQASAPMTVLLGALLTERISPLAMGGVLVAAAGLTLVGVHRAEHASIAPFLLTLAAAAGWAIGNICNRQAHAANPLRFTLWMAVVPPLPLFALSLLVEGPQRIADAAGNVLTARGLLAVAGLLFTVVVATVVASGIWTWLMTLYPASTVAPFSMLVPVFGMSTAWLVLGERVPSIELVGAAIVVAGVWLTTRRSTGATATLGEPAP